MLKLDKFAIFRGFLNFFKFYILLKKIKQKCFKNKKFITFFIYYY